MNIVLLLAYLLLRVYLPVGGAAGSGVPPIAVGGW
jgi:hypothetical protein